MRDGRDDVFRGIKKTVTIVTVVTLSAACLPLPRRAPCTSDVSGHTNVASTMCNAEKEQKFIKNLQFQKGIINQNRQTDNRKNCIKSVKGVL